jgi:hypothetical protein
MQRWGEPAGPATPGCSRARRCRRCALLELQLRAAPATRRLAVLPPGAWPSSHRRQLMAKQDLKELGVREAALQPES